MMTDREATIMAGTALYFWTQVMLGVAVVGAVYFATKNV
jgi:hypothetical protein